MRIDDLIAELEEVKKRHGNIEVTCTASTLPEGDTNMGANVFESTVENLQVHDHKTIGKCVHLWL